jgi:hypothetical protein
VFAPFVKAYVKTFAFKTLTSFDFKAFYLDYFGQMEGVRYYPPSISKHPLATSAQRSRSRPFTSTSLSRWRERGALGFGCDFALEDTIVLCVCSFETLILAIQ